MMPSELDYWDGWGLWSSSDGRDKLYDDDTVQKLFYNENKNIRIEEELWLTDSGTKIYLVQLNIKTKKFELIDKKTIKTESGTTVVMWNELEYVDRNEVWWNIYGKDCIWRINPRTGKIFGWLLQPSKGLKKLHNVGRSWDVFNGIAIDHSNKRVFVTGKKWSKLFEVELVKDNKGLSKEDVDRMCVPSRNIFHI